MSINSWPKPISALRWLGVLAISALFLLLIRSDPNSSAISARFANHPRADRDEAESGDYWLSFRGLQFGVPKDAYRHAVEKMRAMAAARRTRAGIAGAAVSATTPSWQAIGPLPMQNSRANFGGDVFGPTFNATGRVTAITTGTPPQGGTAPICVGTANGGVWMSTDDGATFASITDSLPTQSIGSMLDCGPGMLVGTGEGNSSADSYYGQGLFTSNDLVHWTELAPGTFGRQGITSLARICDRLFAGTGFGESDTRGSAPFAESPGGGIYESTDEGATWTLGFVNANGGAIRTITAGEPGDFSFHTYMAADNAGAFTGELIPDNFDFTTCVNSTFPVQWNNMNVPSADFGRASLTVSDECPVGTANCVVPADTVYAMVGHPNVGTYAGFFVSTDYGASWVAHTVPSVNLNGRIIDGSAMGNSSQAFYDQVLEYTVAADNSITLLFGGLGLYQSVDAGVTWTFLAPNGGTHTDQHALGLTASGLLSGNDGGIYRLANDGTWSSLNNTISAGQIFGVGPHPTNSNRLIAGFQDNGTQLYTGTVGWQVVETGDGGFALFDHTNPNFAYHTYATTGQGPALATSTDSGVTWDFADPTGEIDSITNGNNDTASFLPPLAGDPAVATRVLFGAHHVYASTDGMFTWQLQSLQDLTGGCANSNCALSDLEFAPSDHTKAYALSKQEFGMPATPFKLHNTNQADTNAGATWLDVTGNLPFDTTQTQGTGIAISPFDPNIAYLSVSGFTAATGIGHIFRTGDFGAHWTEADGDLPDIPVLHILVDKTDPSGNTVLAATDIGLFQTTNGGVNWNEFNGSIPAVPVMDIEQNDLGTLFAGTHGRGAYRLNETIPPSATPTQTTTPTATATPEVCGAITVTAQGNGSGHPGDTVAAGSFKIANICPNAIIISLVQVNFTGSSLFSALSLKSTIDGNIQTTPASPVSSTNFNFGPALVIAGGDTGTFDLTGTIANSPGIFTSTQSLAAIGAIDGVSKQTVISGTVPQTLGIINFLQATPTPTSTVIPTHTPTATPTAAVTSTATATRTPASTRTPTPTAGATATATATSTAVTTSTATATSIPTSTATATSTLAATPTPTHTLAATATPTPTATATATILPTPTPAPTIIPVPVALQVTAAGLRNNLINYGKVKVGRFLKKRFTLANKNRSHLPIFFLDGDGMGHSFIVNPGGNFGFLQGVKVTNCPEELLANKSCWLDVYFVPQDNVSNPKTATITLYDDADNAPQVFTLTGTGK